MRNNKLRNPERDPVTVSIMVRDLQALGIEHGDTIIVHSSLTKIGWVCGGAEAVILALLEVVGNEGTIVMPAQTGDNSDPSQWINPPVPKRWWTTIYESFPAFDINLFAPSWMGKVADTFRAMRSVERSNHPSSSFTAFGKDARYLMSEHLLTPAFGEDSPLRRLYDRNAKIVMIGVGYQNCTALHLAEVRSPKKKYKREGVALLENGQRVWKWFEDVNYDSDRFNKIGTAYERGHVIFRGMVGYAKTKVIMTRDLIDFGVKWLTVHDGLGPHSS